jgi:hypothetical protein
MLAILTYRHGSLPRKHEPVLAQDRVEVVVKEARGFAKAVERAVHADVACVARQTPPEERT